MAYKNPIAERNYIDVLVTVPVKLRCRIRNAADLADAYDQAEEMTEAAVDALKCAIKDCDTRFEDTECIDMDYDPDTYDPYPSEDRTQAVRDLGEWRSAS